MALHNIKFKNTKIGKFNLEYDTNFVKSFNNLLNKTQVFLDKKVGGYLEKYVSYRDGDQEKSIAKANTYGKGYVMINVLYAHYQAYSPRIKKKDGLRGTKPFERMKADKSQTILNDAAEYSRKELN